MAVDYDVVAIGSSPAGLYTAIAATYLKARVALVVSPLLSSAWSESGWKYSKALTQVGRVAYRMGEASSFGLDWQCNDESVFPRMEVRFAEALKWAKGVVSTLDEQHSPAVLASLGVDVIFGEGEFCRKPHLGFVVNGQTLRSRTYLIATGSRPAIPDIDGLASAGFWTPETIWQQTNANLPKSLIIIGGDPVGVELAQTFARLGSRVTLVVKSSHILTKEDREAALLIQAQLEAEGVRIFTGHQATQVKWIDRKKWVQVGDLAIEGDEILVAVGQQPNVESLNLEGVGIKFDRHGIQVNRKLQTAHSRIYACGDVLGGYRFAGVANYEARIALKNMLFFPLFKVDYRHLSWAIFSEPELARVGLTEEQAKRRYDDVLVLRRYFKTVDKAQMLGETTGFCKILVRQNGEILGAHLVGPQASELIHAIALAKSQGLKINAIANLTTAFPTLSEITSQTASEWQHLRLSKNYSLQNFLEGFFNLVRSWSS